MPIVLARIDDRLIHGQVVEGWLRIIDANYIVIVSDEVAKDKMQQTLLSIAVPNSIKVSSYGVEEAADKIKKGAFKTDKVLLLFSRPQDVLRLLKNGVALSSVNVGGMHFVTGKKQLLRNLSVDEDDIRALLDISSQNIELEGRVLPNDERIDISAVIKEEQDKTKIHG